MIPTDVTIDPALQPQSEAFLEKTRQDIENMEISEIQDIIRVFQLRLIELTVQNKALELAQSEADILHRHYRTLFDCAPVGYVLLEKDETIKKANPVAAALLECEVSALKGKKFSKFIGKKSQDAYYLHYRSIFRTDGIKDCELQLANDSASRIKISSCSINAPDPVCLTVLTAVAEEAKE